MPRRPTFANGCVTRQGAGWAPALVLFGAAACGGSSAVTPAASSSSAGQARVVSVTLSDTGCHPSDFSLRAGTVIFSVTNSGSTQVEEMEIDDESDHIVGDVEGVQPGTTRSFVVDLTPGTYQVNCPESARRHGTLTVR